MTELEQLQFALSNTVDPINVIHLNGLIKEAMEKKDYKEKKITSVVISSMPKTMWDNMPTVTATFDDGSVKELFSYYPDELSFAPEEFVGLTEEQARTLKFNKD